MASGCAADWESFALQFIHMQRLDQGSDASTHPQETPDAGCLGLVAGHSHCDSQGHESFCTALDAAQTPHSHLKPRPTLALWMCAGKTKVAHIQRSCGYALRPTLSIDDIERAIKIIKAQVWLPCWGRDCRVKGLGLKGKNNEP